jgi:hypothetical protein
VAYDGTVWREIARKAAAVVASPFTQNGADVLAASATPTTFYPFSTTAAAAAGDRGSRTIRGQDSTTTIGQSLVILAGDGGGTIGGSVTLKAGADGSGDGGSILLQCQSSFSTNGTIRLDTLGPIKLTQGSGGTDTKLLIDTSGQITLGGTATEHVTFTGNLKLNGSTSGTITLSAGATPTSTTYTLPSAFGSAGQVLTDAAGNGTLSWAAATGPFTDAGTYIHPTTTTDGLFVGTSTDESDLILAVRGVSPRIDVEIDGGVNTGGQGGSVTLNGATTDGANFGGAIASNGGRGGPTGVGGNITSTAGDGGVTSGNGGANSSYAGDATDGNGGTWLGSAGDAGAGGSGGSWTARSGSADTLGGEKAVLTLSGGTATGGGFSFAGGKGANDGSGAGGAFTATTGIGGSSSGTSGAWSIASGTTTDGNTGGGTLSTANATGTNRSSGSISVTTGTFTGSGAAGTITLGTNNATVVTVTPTGAMQLGNFGAAAVSAANTVAFRSNAGVAEVSQSGGAYAALATGVSPFTQFGANVFFTDAASTTLFLNDTDQDTAGVRSIRAPNGTVTGAGSILQLFSGDGGTTSGASGTWIIASGSTLDGNTGTGTIRSAHATGTNRVSGDINIIVGSSSGSATAGSVFVIGGGGGATGVGSAFIATTGIGGNVSGASGAWSIASGTTTDGNTGGGTLSTANATGTDRSSGSITLSTGTPTGSGTAGLHTFSVGGASQLVLGSTGATSYRNVTTAGWGVPAIYGSAQITGQTTNATIATYTVGAATGDFEISATVNVSAVTAISTSVDVTYTDTAGNARTLTMPVQLVGGTGGTYLASGLIVSASANDYVTPTTLIRAQNGTAITVKTAAGTFTGVTYSASASIKQVR